MFMFVYIFMIVLCLVVLQSDSHDNLQVEMSSLAKKKVKSVRDMRNVRFPGLPVFGHQMELKFIDGKQRCHGFSTLLFYLSFY